jgi:hypothetical protein
MRTKLEIAHDVSSIGTFVLTIILVALMVIPMLWPSQAPQSSVASAGKPAIAWVMPSILAFCIVLASVLHFLAARAPRRSERSLSRAEVLQKMPANLPTIAHMPVLPGGRVPTNATPDELSKLWKGNTAVQAGKLSEIYIGTWMTISGSVFDVRRALGGDQMLISVKTGSFMLAQCYFHEDWEHRCSVHRKDDSVVISGKVTGFDEHTLSLEDCELVSTER